jgi:Tfp pilus assembly protein PilO
MKNLKNLTQLRKYQIFIWPLVILLLIFISALVFVKPKVIQILALHKTYSQEKKKLASVTQKASFLESLDQVELASKSKKVLEVLPPEADVAQILLVLKSLAQENGLIFSKIVIDPGGLSTASAQTKSSKEGIPSLNLSVSVGGEEGNLYSFLQRVENTLPVMKAGGVSLSPKGGGFSEMDFSLQAFFSFLPASLGKIEDPISNLTPQEESIYRQIQELQPVLAEGAFPEGLPVGKENLFSF